MTISLITGGAGFIGSHMVDLLVSKGHEVRIIDNLSAGKKENIKQYEDNPKVIFQPYDILEYSKYDSIFAKIDYVFHFAGIPSIRPSLESPNPYIKNNVLGTSSMLEISRHANVKKFVYAASSACYGEADIHPTPETAEIKLQHPYGLSKHLGEIETLHWGQVFDVPVISLRMFDVFGRRADSTVIGIFQRMKAAGKPITIFGDGNQTRDFVDVKDVCQAYLMAAESKVTGEVFNVGTGNPQTINHLVDLMGGEKTYLPKRENEPYKHCADITKIKSMLGWEPQISFEDTINDLLQDSDTSKAA